MERRRYNIKPKCFTDCWKTIKALLVVTEVSKLWKCLVLLEMTSMRFFLSLGLSMLVVAISMISMIYYCSE